MRDCGAIEDIGSFKLLFQALRHRLHHALRKMTSESPNKVSFTVQVEDRQIASRRSSHLTPNLPPVSPMGWRGEGRNKSITSVVKDR